MNIQKYRIDIKGVNLKVTPQRTAVLEALNSIKNHPTADNIKEFVIKNHPNISVGTIYKTLETFVEKGIIKRVKTHNGIMRYDAVLSNHHHLYCEKTEQIEDFFDEELNTLLKNYFKKKKVPNFTLKEIKLQLNGEFKKS
jgi:Fur family transcriptional regulator, peroxide stress response regulator